MLKNRLELLGVNNILILYYFITVGKYPSCTIYILNGKICLEEKYYFSQLDM